MGFKNWLIKLLGGYTNSEFSSISETAKNLEPYKEFAESIKIYAGNYPAWKAQSEFREVMHMLGKPLTANPDSTALKHADYVDLYLGRVVDGLASIYRNEDPCSRWDNKNARGVGYLNTDNNQQEKNSFLVEGA